MRACGLSRAISTFRAPELQRASVSGPVLISERLCDPSVSVYNHAHLFVSGGLHPLRLE